MGYRGGAVSNVLNLNAKRAARATARGEAMQMVLGTETFDLVDEMPIEIGDLAAGNKITDALRMLLARPDEDWARLMAQRPSFNDVLDIVEFFGAQLGESLKSQGSSKRTGTRSRQTGNGSTIASLPTISMDEVMDKAPANAGPAPVA